MKLYGLSRSFINVSDVVDCIFRGSKFGQPSEGWMDWVRNCSGEKWFSEENTEYLVQTLFGILTDTTN